MIEGGFWKPTEIAVHLETVSYRNPFESGIQRLLVAIAMATGSPQLLQTGDEIHHILVLLSGFNFAIGL